MTSPNAPPPDEQLPFDAEDRALSNQSLPGDPPQGYGAAPPLSPEAQGDQPDLAELERLHVAAVNAEELSERVLAGDAWSAAAFPAQPWLLAQAREAERLRAELESGKAELEQAAESGDTVVASLSYVGQEYLRSVMGRARKLTALEAELAETEKLLAFDSRAVERYEEQRQAFESALHPLVGGSVTVERVREAVGHYVEAARLMRELYAGIVDRRHAAEREVSGWLDADRAASVIVPSGPCLCGRGPRIDGGECALCRTETKTALCMGTVLAADAAREGRK